MSKKTTVFVYNPALLAEVETKKAIATQVAKEKENASQEKSKQALTQTEDWREILRDLSTRATEEIQDIATRAGNKIEFELRFTNAVREGISVVIKAGLVPEIYIAESFLMRLAMLRIEKKSPRFLLRKVLRMAYDNLGKVKLTITKPVKLSEYRVLRDEADRFMWGSPDKEYLRYVNPARFIHHEIHTVTVMDPLTETSITVQHEDVGMARQIAVKRLQRTISENPELLAIHDAYTRRELAGPQIPEVLEVVIDDNESMLITPRYQGDANE